MFALSLHYQKDREDKLEKRLRKLSLQPQQAINVGGNRTPTDEQSKKEPQSNHQKSHRRISAPELVRPVSASALITSGTAAPEEIHPPLKAKKKSSEMIKIPPAIPEEIPNDRRKGASQLMSEVMGLTKKKK